MVTGAIRVQPKAERFYLGPRFGKRSEVPADYGGESILRVRGVQGWAAESAKFGDPDSDLDSNMKIPTPSQAQTVVRKRCPNPTEEGIPS